MAKAKEPLFFRGVRAYNKGNTVPDDQVERNGWEDKVTGYKPAKAVVKKTAQPEAS